MAEIIDRNCLSCHRTGGPAPFSLEEYEDVRARARSIVSVTVTRRMPPWLPTDGDYPLANERSLDDREVAMLEKWAERGALEGEHERSPESDVTQTTGWVLGKPDLVLEMPEPFILPALEDVGEHDGHMDVFRSFVLPTHLAETKYVRAVELLASDWRVLHHAIIGVDPTGTSSRTDAKDAGIGFDGMASGAGALQPAGFVLGWTPGAVPRPNPDGMAWPLPAGSEVVVHTHLMPAADTANLLLKLGVFFGEPGEGRRPLLRNLYLTARAIDIPAGTADHLVEDSFVLPADVEILSLYPHAHYLARSFVLHAEIPGVGKRVLLGIDRWDFDWQDSYQFADPVELPAGSRLVMRWIYDNSEDNPHNPYHPPRRVTYGYSSTDEMGEVWIQARVRDPGDHDLVQAAVDRKRDADHTALFSHLARLAPDDAVAHANLGGVLARQRRRQEAIEHYEHALALSPEFDRAHYELGILREAGFDTVGALGHYGEAVEAFPDYLEAHEALGNLLYAQDPEAAELHFRRALEIDPASIDAHLGLGNIAKQREQMEVAVEHYRAAAEAAPADAGLRYNLAQNLILAGEGDAAMLELERAARLAPAEISPQITAAWILASDPRPEVRRPHHAIQIAQRLSTRVGEDHPLLLDLSAAAYAAAGDFERARSLAVAGRMHAMSRGDPALAARIAERIALYARSEPYLSSRGPYAN